MHHWREKVADKLSRLLADSPSPQSPRTPSHPLSPAPRPNAQELASEDLNSSIASTFSSYLLSFVPSIGTSGDASVSNNNLGTPSARKLDAWKYDGFGMEGTPPCEVEESGTESESDEMVYFTPMYNGPPLEKNGFSENGPEKASSSHSLGDFSSVLTEKSTFMSSELLEFFQSCLPNIVKGCQWVLLYSTLKHGTSLRTLLRNSSGLPGPCLLIVGDMQGATFGGLLECPLKPTSKRKYQGTNQTFIFTTISGEPTLFKATGANRYYYMCLNDLLAFGGGGSFALCLEEDLLHGSSGPCQTFDNPCLAHSPEFELKNVELWGFTHSSRYLT